jgi:hypothetical protein
MCPYPEQHEASQSPNWHHLSARPILLRPDISWFSIPFSLNAQASSKRGGNGDSNSHR